MQSSERILQQKIEVSRNRHDHNPIGSAILAFERVSGFTVGDLTPRHRWVGGLTHGETSYSVSRSESVIHETVSQNRDVELLASVGREGVFFDGDNCFGGGNTPPIF